MKTDQLAERYRKVQQSEADEELRRRISEVERTLSRQLVEQFMFESSIFGI